MQTEDGIRALTRQIKGLDPGRPAAVPERGSGVPATGPAASRWLRQALFLEHVERFAGWRHVLWAVLAVVAGAAVSLARTGGPGALNTTWIEDASRFLQDALHQSVLTTLTTQSNGYYNTLPRAVTAIAIAFPLTWVPGIMSAAAALGYGLVGLIAYLASGPHLRNPLLRLLVAAPACVIPLAYTQANNDLATLQFYGLYATFWLLLWRPASRAWRTAAPVIMLAITLSSVLPVLFAPLAAARIVADRSKAAIAVVASYAAGLLAQWSVQWRGMSDRPAYWFTSPLWVLGNYVTRVVPRAIFGERALGGPGTNGEGHPLPLNVPNPALHGALVWGAWALLAAVVIVAIAMRGAPNWPLATAAAAFSVLVFLGEVVDNLPVIQPRYVIAPALLLYVAIAALLRPGTTADHAGNAASGVVLSGDADCGGVRRGLRSAVAARSPVVVFAVLIAVTCGFNFRVTNNRSESPPWSAVVAAATRSCLKPGTGDYIYRHAWWQLKIPCSKVGAQ